MRRILGALLLGALAGGLLVHLSHSRSLEQLHWEKEKLKVQLLKPQRGSPGWKPCGKRSGKKPSAP